MPKNEVSKGKQLSLWSLVALATGQVIGAGVITVTGQAVGATGKATWIAYAVASVLGLLVILPVLFYSSVARYRGGQYTIVTSLMGEKWGGVYSLMSISACVAGGLVGTAIGTYINSVFPFIDIRVAAIASMTLFFLLNLYGVNIMASFQSFMTVFLIICLLGFCVAGLGKLQPGTFAVGEPGYFSGGSKGFLAAIVLLVYSTTGHSLVVAFSADAKDAKKNIPLSMIITSAIILVIYMMIGLVASNVLPIETVANKPLTLVAREILPTPLFAIFIFGGPIMALATTMNSGYPALCAPILGGIRDGWMPKALGKTNKYGAPYILFTGMYLIGIAPILMNFSLSTITNNTILVTYIIKILVIVSMFYLPKKFGEHWKASKFYIRNTQFYILMFISLVAQVGIIVLSAKELPLPVLIGNIVVVTLLCSYAFYRAKSGKAQPKISYSFDD